MVVVFAGTSALSVFAKRDTAFRPEEQTVHVFPSVVKSDTWHNLNSLGVQDLRENALYQDFGEDNAAYINTDGVLPKESATAGYNQDVIDTVVETPPRVETTESIEPEPQDPPSTSATDTVESTTDDSVKSIESNDSTIDPVSPDEQTDVPNTEASVQIQEAAPLSDTSTEEVSAPDSSEEETAIEPKPEPEPEPESVSQPEETSQGESVLDPVVSFFKRVTSSFAFTQAASTSPISNEVSDEESVEENIDLASPTSDIEFTDDNGASSSLSDTVSTPEATSTDTSASDGEEVSGLDLDEVPPESVDTVVVEADQPENKNPDVKYTVTFENFGVPTLASGQFVNNLQLRLSLGSRYELEASTTLPTLRATYSFGEFSGNAGSILLGEEISNALNGGYFLLPMPTVSDPSLLSDLSITLEFVGDIELLQGLYVDALWLEVGTVVFDAELLKQRYAPEQLHQLKGFRTMEFLGTTLDFTRDELPEFSMRYNAQRNIAVRAVRSVFGRKLAEIQSVKLLHGRTTELGIAPDITITADGLITVLIPEEEKKKMKPGVYEVQFEINEGGVVYEDSFEFQWGLLAINTNQTEYSKNDRVEVSMGSLSPNGNTVCDANLNLYVTDPRGFISREPVLESGLCNGNNVVSVPDYSSSFSVDQSGEYQLYLERLDDTGKVIAHTGSTFSVVNKQKIALSRLGPTRIYPPASYPMQLTIQTKDSAFSGSIIERVPRDFEIFNTDASVTRYADFTELVWDISLLGSTTKSVSYEFDAPDISPYLYELGPARLIDDAPSQAAVTQTASGTASTTDIAVQRQVGDSTVIFEEHRQWQIASDAVGSMILFWDDGASVPVGWTCISCLGTDTFNQNFMMGSSSYNVVGGATTHSHTGTASVNASALSDAEDRNGTTVSGVTHTHTLGSTFSTESNLPSYRELRVIQYNSAGEPTTIPAGAIGIFDVASSSLPTGWNRYAAQDGYYAYGGDTPGTTGGSDTHNHDVTGTTGASAGSTEGNRGGGTPGTAAPASHTHDISTTTGQLTNQPPYIEVLFAKLSADAVPPNNLIAMWSEDTPSGWVDVSSDGASAFSNRFFKAATTYGATGGSESHSISDMSGIVSSIPNQAAVTTRTGTAGADDTHTHIVNITGISDETHLPPYATVVIGKRQGTSPVYNQLYYRWYANNTSNQTPSDPWPSGAEDLVENEQISATSTPVKSGEVLRLRMSVGVSNATSTAGVDFKLQYGAGSSCTTVTWSNVGDASSSTAQWRGYDNSGVTDHTMLSTTVLATSTVAETYEENGYATSTPNQISVDQVAEWDFVLQHNGADAGTNYCFRMVNSDGTPFTTYSGYPKLYTNESPTAPTLDVLFDNEKTASTSPWFEFVASDTEGESMHYQIQVDDDYGFGSTLLDRNTISNSSLFENLVTPADKAPFNQGELMQFTPSETFSNGTTYYWRVRAADPDGSDVWGDWSDIRSFTIDTGLSVSAWYQTTEEQFDTNNLVGLETPADYVSVITGSSTGVMKSTPIRFNDGALGSAWGSFSFTESDTGGVINYQIEYLTDAATWALIPDGDLTNNSIGLTAATSLLNLDTETYSTIRLVANFTGTAGSPQVTSWTVTWGYRVETPTISKLFPNEKTSTTTPTFEFTTTDPQSDSLTYEVSWSSDNTFTSSTTRNSASHTGFINADDGGDVEPFNSGETIRFTIQPADALTDGMTYWWRVRAKDTTGDNAYSLWTNAQSFTASSGVTASTWFQTTEEQFGSNILSGTVAFGSDAVSVATTATEALVVYGEGTETLPKFRQWNGISWSDEGSLNDIGAPLRWAVVKAGVTREEYVAATVGTDADINVQVFSTGEWGNLQEVTTNMGDINSRGFDVAYETLSGDAIVAFCDGDADPSYYVWNGTSWVSGGTINLASANNCEWIKLASDPTSDEIILLAGDALGGQFEAQVWNGSTWGNSSVQGSLTNEDHEGLAVMYESSGDQAVIVTSDGNPRRFSWNTWNGTTWGTAATQSLGKSFEWGKLVADDGSDELALCYSDGDSDIGMVLWTGSAWTGQTELEVDGNAINDPAFSCIFETVGARDNYVMTVLSDTAQTEYSFWNNTAWSTNAQVSSITDTATMQLERTGVGDILGIFFDDPNDRLLFSAWNGSAWSTAQILEDNMSVGTSPYGHPYSIAPRNSGKDGTTIVSPGIDFYDGSGPYWHEMSWVDSTPGLSEILYSMQYYDSASSTWKMIPDADLAGNESGITTSPIDLSSLDINTYNLIRPYAALSCDGSGNCPILYDWTVEWAEGITVSGTIQQYDQSTAVTGGTVAVAVNGVLQIGKTGTVSGGTWSIPNVTVFENDIVTVFVSDTDDSTEAVGVTRYDGSGDITGVQLFERHLSLGSDDITSNPLTNADVALYNVTNDEDVFVGLTGSALDVCATTGCADAKLFIGTNSMYRPGSNVLTHDIENNGTLIATSTLYLTGSWDNNATTTMTGSTVVFEATSTSESIDSTGAVSAGFNNVIFGTTTGSATWTLTTSLDVNGDLRVERGTLSRGTAEIAVAGDLTNGTNGFWSGIGTTTFDGSGTSNWSDQNTSLQNVGAVVVEGSAKTVVLTGNVGAESITIGGDDVLSASASGYDITLYRDWTNNGTFVAQTGAVNFAAVTTGIEIQTGGDAFYDLSFVGAGGAWSFTEPTVTVNNNLTIATGTLTLPSATTTIAGSFSAAGGTFVHNNASLEFTSSGPETIVASTTLFTNEFYNLTFDGSGTWTFLDQNATTTNDVLIDQGTVVFPSGTFAIGGTLQDRGGSFSGNSGTVVLTSDASETLTAGGSVFNNLTTIGSGSWTFSDTNVTIAGDLAISSGTLTLPSGVLSLGGSLQNSATLANNSGQITFNSTDSGETIDTGSSLLYDAVFDSATGGWTIISSATTTNNLTLTAASDFTLASGQILEVAGSFSSAVDGASTTWTGSTLYLNGGNIVDINTKTSGGDAYGTLAVGVDTDVKMWNSSATVYAVNASGSLYSKDHAAVDGDLYIFGLYERTGGSEYWSYATDFDGDDLSGGNERQANVYLADGADVSIIDGVFAFVGAESASTTVQNQGSGTYTLAVTNSTTTAQYYDFMDLGGSGLSLLGETIVTNLADGSFTVGTDAGSALSISSSTIDANPGLQIYRVQFATTTAISAYNVSQTIGTPSSYWWFRDSSGNLYGEQFDNDTGDPGSIRWDNSSLVVTIAGTVYDNDQSTPLTTSTCGVGTPVRVVVEGGATYDGACSGVNGSFSIPNVVIVGDPVITVFLNGADNGEQATAITKTVTADVTNLNLYVDHVIVRHEDTAPITIADMAAYDFVNDTDVQFTAATSTLEDTLDVFAGNALYVWASSTFTPGGPVTLNGNGQANTHDGSLYIGGDATFTGSGTTTYTIAGSLSVASGGTFVPASSTVVMNATTTGKTIDAAAGETISFNELQFTGVGGGWNINGNASTTDDVYVAAGTVTGTGNVTIENGSFYGDGLVSLGGGTVVIENGNTLGGTQGWTFNNLMLGNGVAVGTTTPGGNATTTVGGTLTINTAHYLDAGSSVWDFAGTGTVFVENGTFLEDTSTVRYSGTAAADILSTGYYDLILDADGGSPTYTAVGSGVQVFGDLLVGLNGVTTVDFTANDPALNIEGNLSIGANGTFIASDSNSFTLAGSYDNNGTFTGSGGALTFDGSGTHTIAAGNSSFGSVVIDGSGNFTVTEHATATDAWTLTNANNFTVNSGVVLAVGGIFTNNVGGSDTVWTDSILSLYGGGNYEINASATSDTYATLAVAADTQIRMWNSSAASYAIDSAGSLYSMDHADTPGDLYVYGAYEKTTGTDHWSYATDFDGTDLSGGSERTVDVYVAAGGSMTYRGSGLSVVGISSATTTVQNQGSGNFSIVVGDAASATLSYYSLSDLNSNGLTFSGAPTVSSISQGAFFVSVEGGSAITVGGTAIDANPAKTFTGNAFNTSAGTAYNVTATGTTVSSWRFTNHSGTIDGEGFDVDPDGDPGYIVWDDSAASITIAGKVYQADESSVSTACPDATIRVRVAGLTTYDGTCDGSGQYSIGAISYSPGDSIIVYISGETEKGAVVTVDPVSNINNMDIYENTVIVRHENADPLSINDMSVWDSSDDVDIPFTAINSSPDTLSLPSDTRLVLWTNKTFEPGGDVTLSSAGSQSYRGDLVLKTGATFTANNGEEHTIGGSLLSGSGATFAPGTASTTFTTTGSGRTIDINNGSFYNVAFTGSGSWTIADNVLNVHDFAQSAGTLTLPLGTTTISGFWNVVGGSFNHNGSMMVFDGSTADTIVSFGGSDTSDLQFVGSGSWNMTDVNATSTGSVIVSNGDLTLPSGSLVVGGDFRNTGGSIIHNTSELVLATSSAATLLASSSDLYAVTFTGGGTFTMEDLSLTLLDTLLIESGSVQLATGTLAIGGSFDASGGTFDHATGTILFNSADTGEIINPGISDFYNVNLASALGGWTIVSSATTTNNFALSNASDFTLQSGAALTVGGVFTNSVSGAVTDWSGSTLRLMSGTEYSINNKTDSGDAYQTIIVGPHTDLSIWNSYATSTTVAASGSLYSQDHAAVDGALSIYGDYHISTTTEFWSYATDFDGASLSGGNERPVTVALASGATTTVDGGSLQMVGVSGNETTVTNQGSGTYALAVSAGTFNSQYVQYRNLNANGLLLTGTPTITSLNYSDFELAVSGGSLISLASSTLNANASKVITGARFATTTAITGYNVYLTGVTSNAWTFSAHTGNLDGEDFDVDGATECGSIRWSDSACLLTQQTHYRWRNDDGGVGVPNSEWFDTDWSKRKSVRIKNDDTTTYTDAAVELLVSYDNDMQSDFDDLRFTDAGGTTTLPFFIASTTISGTAEVWVKIPTLPAEDSLNIQMYYGNAVAVSSSSAEDVFIVADSFEDGDISEYSGDTSLFAVDGSFAYGGAYGLDNTGNESSRATDGIFNTSVTVSQGETIRFMQYVDTTAGSGDEVCTLFAVQSPGTNNTNYGVCLEQFGTDRVSLVRDVKDTDSSGTILASTSISYTTGWYEVEIDWHTNDDIDVTVNQDGVTAASLSANDSTYTSGGIGFTYWFHNGGWDNYSSRPLLTTEPTVQFGGEQVRGGATWAADTDTPFESVPVGDTARLRVVVDNSGLQISNQTYQLEFAERGAAPSCEAVTGASYAAVPTQSSCGSSPVCMKGSTNVANGAVIADLISLSNGEFTNGFAVEDPSNTASTLTLGQDQYTELEYVLTPTVGASDPNLCFRVTNAGSELDTYLRVAELTVRFDPSLGAITFNNGDHISLVGGTTTRVYATSTVTDQNGYADIVSATSTMYRSGVGASCTADENNCYISAGAPQCTFSNCAGNSCDVECYADIFYLAEPTDTDSIYEGEQWIAMIEVVDAQGGIDIDSSVGVTDMYTLRSLEVGEAIDYGALEVYQDTGSYNASTTIQNEGNDSIDVEIVGSDLSDGQSSTIPASEQKFATSTFTYSACTYCTNLDTAATTYNLNLSKPTSIAAPVTDDIYWGISVPFGTKSNPHTGVNTFYAISDN